MPCEHYKDAVIEAAAGGGAPSGELRAHLTECVSCQLAFNEEQSLYAAIDSDLHAIVNMEIPPSLLPRVRNGIGEAMLSRRGWFANRLVWAVAAAATVVLFAARFVVHTNTEHQPPDAIASKASPSSAMRPVQNPLVVAALPEETPARVPHVSLSPTSVRLAVANPSMPEVLVPRDQEVLLAQYAQQWQRHKPTTLVPADADWTALTPLQPAPIQISPLDVKLLKEVESQ